MQLTFIDHYDSFSCNVVEWLRAADRLLQIDVIAFDDQARIQEIITAPRPLVLSPGPGHPADNAAIIDLCRRCWGQVPILGVCLGHQILAYSRGAAIRRHCQPHHGTVRSIRVVASHSRMFEAMPSSFQAGVYNSLTVELAAFPTHDLVITAVDEFGEIQAFESVSKVMPLVAGFQFHPESFLTENGIDFARRWLRSATDFKDACD